MNRHVRVEAGVDGTIVVVAAYCPRCRREVMPRADGCCTWCDTQIVDEDRLSARQMLLKLGTLPERDATEAVVVAPRGSASPPAPSRSRSVPAWTEETAVAAIQSWAIEYGAQPKSTEWATRRVDGRPTTNQVVRLFGSWSAGVRAAGFEPIPRHFA